MALSPQFTIEQDLATGETLTFTDATGDYNATSNTGGYGAPNAEKADILATRFIFSDDIREEDATTVAALEPYKEYTTDTEFTYDTDAGKTAYVGEPFIPLVAFTVPDGVTVTETGRYYVVSDFVPTDETTTISLDDVGLTDEKFSDRVCNFTYEVYKTETASGAIVDDSVYIVKSTTSTDRVTYNGSEYRPDEVFTGRDAVATFTTTGSPQVIKREALIENIHFLTSYYSRSYLQELRALIAYKKPNANIDALRREVSYLETDLNGLLETVTDIELNISGATNLIAYIAKEYNRIKRQYS